MILCAWDLETTGLQVDTCRILEIACVLYDTDTNSSFEHWSSYVYSSDYPMADKEALDVTGINWTGLRNFGQSPREAISRAVSYFARANALVGHNSSNFDWPIMARECRALKIELPRKVLIDSRIDLPFPERMGSKRLQHLSVDHKLQWDHDLAHSALYDCQKMLAVASHYDLEEAYVRAQSPMILVETVIPRERNIEAKNRRYFWNPQRRVWQRHIREIDFEKEKKEATFIVTKVQSGP